MSCSFGAILAWKSDAAADDYDNDRKSDPYMSPSYAAAGDTIKSFVPWSHLFVGMFNNLKILMKLNK